MYKKYSGGLVNSVITHTGIALIDFDGYIVPSLVKDAVPSIVEELSQWVVLHSGTPLMGIITSRARATSVFGETQGYIRDIAGAIKPSRGGIVLFREGQIAFYAGRLNVIDEVPLFHATNLTMAFSLATRHQASIASTIVFQKQTA